MCFADQFHPDISIYAFVLFDSKFLYFYRMMEIKICKFMKLIILFCKSITNQFDQNLL